MLVTPQRMISEKWVFAPDRQIEPKQLQQIGFDLRVKSIQLIAGTARIMCNSKELPSYVSVPFNDNCWFLEKGLSYAFECVEQCTIPLGYEGKVIHRSTFNRSGCFITGSVYDPGYRGIIAGTMYVHTPLFVEFETCIAQFQMQTAEIGNSYDGDYQDQISHVEAAEKLDGKDDS